ncbi:glycosyltransferase family 2 protein [Nonomuraea sp. NPDC050404]|uniref:glycosyltransferase family 2 protein n=1 Tax=Nonomuraea sp. NPDC050404 TaxID=3155783 RepID=UPI00340AB3AA
MGVKVSVILDVHNPGDSADASIRSALDQTMPADEYEVIFVDDGSTDGIGERLDAIAVVRDNVRTLRLPYTGSPMRGRNVGLASAAGDYVFFLGPSDRLERDAVERMYDRAVETDADVLVGRLVRDYGPPMTAFARSTGRAGILRDRLLTLLQPQQLYRRAFLEEHELGFAVPGGRMAEQAFVLRAYLQAKVIAVLADHLCCHLGERPPTEEEPRAIVGELRGLLDDIDLFVDEGRQRDRMYAYWLRYALLRPLLTSKFADSSVDRGMHFRVVQEFMAQRFPDRLDRYLPVQLRVVAAYVRMGRLDQIVLMSNASRRAGLRADLTEVRWDAHVLVLGLTVEVLDGGGSPDKYRLDGERVHWSPPRSLESRKLPKDVTDITEDVERARIDVYVRHTGTGVVHFLPMTQRIERVPAGRRRTRVRIRGEARLDITSAAVGAPLRPGQWEVHVRMFSGASQAKSRVSRPDGPLNCLGVLAQRPRMRLVVPCWSDQGELGLAIEPRSFSESIALVSPGVTVKHVDRYLYVVLPVPYVPPSGGPALELVMRTSGRRAREVSAPALVEAGVPGRLTGQLVAKVPVKRLLPGVEHLGPGTWSCSLRSAEEEIGLRFALEMRRGRVESRPASGGLPERRSPLGRDSLLHRLGRRLPGARHLVRMARSGRHRYLTD